jgi:hypothetical protein
VGSPSLLLTVFTLWGSLSRLAEPLSSGSLEFGHFSFIRDLSAHGENRSLWSRLGTLQAAQTLVSAAGDCLPTMVVKT